MKLTSFKWSWHRNDQIFANWPCSSLNTLVIIIITIIIITILNRMHLSWCSLTYGTIYIDLSKSNKCEMKYFHGAYVKRQQCLLCVWRTIRHGCGISSVSIVEHGYQGIIRESKGREVNRVARSTRIKKLDTWKVVLRCHVVASTIEPQSSE